VGPGSTYRTRLLLRIVVGGAALFWLGMAVAASKAPDIGPRPLEAASAFAAFFIVAYLAYARTWVSVGPRSIVASTLFGRRRVSFDDVLRIVVREGPLGRVVAVVTRRGLVHFTSLFSRHRELLALLIERTQARRA
jgi:hypothetical protein